MTPEELAAIRERANAATAGPWSWDEPFDNWIAQNGLGYLDVRNSDDTVIAVLEIKSEKDADFIAESRSDVPALLDEVDRLRAENKRLRARLMECQQAAKMDEAPLLRAENAELRAMIKQLEWTRWRFSWFSDFPETCCPICGRQQRLGHAPDCKLAVLLGR